MLLEAPLMCVCVCASCCGFKEVCKHTHVCACLHSAPGQPVTCEGMCCSLDPKWLLLVFQCPGRYTWKSNCHLVCMCVCVSEHGCPLPPSMPAGSSVHAKHPQTPPQCYLCICSAMRLNPFTSSLNLRAHYTPSRNMPYALHSSDDTHKHSH